MLKEETLPGVIVKSYLFFAAGKHANNAKTD